jgi:serine/threonine-protein kinase RsbW
LAARRVGYALLVSEALRVVLRAGGRSPAQARRVLSSWLARVCGRGTGPADAPDDATEDLVFAVSEAVTNCVDHAYRGGEPGAIRLVGRLDEDRDRDDGSSSREVTVAVSDEGAWCEPTADPGHRGRGLSMMRASVTAFDLVVGRGGTTVTMTQRLSC